MTILRPEKNEYAAYQEAYVSKVHEDDLLLALTNSYDEVGDFYESIPEEKETFRYAEGKWSVLEVLQHIIDCEVVFIYRALSIVRDHTIALPGFDQEVFAAASNANSRSLSDLIASWDITRQQTINLFSSFSEEDSMRIGKVYDYQVSVRALGFMIAGHEAHHVQVLKERYL